MAVSPVVLTVVGRVAITLAGVVRNLSFIDKSFKDVSEGKEPPARSPTWQAVINDANDVEESLRTLKWFNAVLGDVSEASQKDCAKYEGVLVAFREWHDALVASVPDLPILASKLKDIRNTLDDRSHAALEVQKAYQKLAGSPNGVVRNFAGWAFLDLDKVIRALNGAAGEAAKRVTRVEAFQAEVQQRITVAQNAIDAYQNRMPAMRDYCAHHHAPVPDHVDASVV
jgi:hypothetical protein